MENKKTKFSLIFLLVMVMLLSSCSKIQADKPVIKKIVRISHGQPEDHPDHEGMMAFKKHIESKLGDKYEVLVYANGLILHQTHYVFVLVL